MIAAASLCSDFSPSPLPLFPANDLREAAYTFYALLSGMAVIRARPRCHRLRPPPASGTPAVHAFRNRLQPRPAPLRPDAASSYNGMGCSL